MGSVEMKVNYPQGQKKDLNVSAFQAFLLIQFNQKISWSLTELRTVLDIPELELKRHLLSLCTPKLRILRKSSNSKVSCRMWEYLLLFIPFFVLHTSETNQLIP